MAMMDKPTELTVLSHIKNSEARRKKFNIKLITSLFSL